jgi:beta-glucosidase
MPRTAFAWPITPEVMYWAARFHYERYGLPILVTENGMANTDFVMEDGKVHDPQRADFLRRYLRSLKKAADEGIPVLGYQYWSILDNFEWCSGYDMHFGLVYVDYLTQKRTVKDSAWVYRDIIRTNGNMF